MATLMNYKGYYGSIDASAEDGCLFGKLELISSLINYEAETVPELTAAFHDAVDDYLADCDSAGIAPEVPCKGSFNAHVGHTVRMQAVKAAKEEGITLNEFARRAPQAQIDHHSG